MHFGLYLGKRIEQNKNMETPLDSKIIRCRYGSEDKVVKDYACFGWTIASKTLLNRFGNPLPVDARVSEDDKREKCSWELTFKRFVSPEKAQKLYLLEMSTIH